MKIDHFFQLETIEIPSITMSLVIEDFCPLREDFNDRNARCIVPAFALSKLLFLNTM
jgi:hypothetical protein